MRTCGCGARGQHRRTCPERPPAAAPVLVVLEAPAVVKPPPPAPVVSEAAPPPPPKTETELLQAPDVRRAVRSAANHFLRAHPRFIPHAEDVASEADIAALSAIRGYNGQSSLPTRVYSIVKYRLLDWAREQPVGVVRCRRIVPTRVPTEAMRGSWLERRHAMERGTQRALARPASLDARYPDGRLVNDLPGRLDVLGPVEDRDEFMTLVRPLGRREREIVLFYYFEDLTMAEIGQHMDLSESRVCQLHARAIEKMRAATGVAAPAA